MRRVLIRSEIESSSLFYFISQKGFEINQLWGEGVFSKVVFYEGRFSAGYFMPGVFYGIFRGRGVFHEEGGGAERVFSGIFFREWVFYSAIGGIFWGGVCEGYFPRELFSGKVLSWA